MKDKDEIREKLLSYLREDNPPSIEAIATALEFVENYSLDGSYVISISSRSGILSIDIRLELLGVDLTVEYDAKGHGIIFIDRYSK